MILQMAKATTKEKQYAPDDMAKAIEKVKSGCSILRASQIFNVPRSTLSYKSHGLHINTRKGPEPVLTQLCEETLVKWICTMKERGFPVTFNFKKVCK
jgi:hypothetical protein